jgi:dihydropteroate synthase
MGVLNITPDSFSDGGLFLSAQEALTHGLRLLDEGADILDIGGESTRPGSVAVTASEEMARVLPTLTALRRARPAALLSIDTTKAAVARAAVAAGADIVNDVSGFLWDDSMPAACAELECGVIVMHTRGRPDVWKLLPDLRRKSVLPLVREGLADSLQMGIEAGVRREAMAIDPGFGFGKRGDENYWLLADLPGLATLARPMAVGLSRKGFLARTLGQISPPETIAGRRWHEDEAAEAGSEAANEAGAESAHETAAASGVPAAGVPVGGVPATGAAAAQARAIASLTAGTMAILAGAHIVRAHEVRPAIEAAAIADALLNAG